MLLHLIVRRFRPLDRGVCDVAGGFSGRCGNGGSHIVPYSVSARSGGTSDVFVDMPTPPKNSWPKSWTWTNCSSLQQIKTSA